MRLAVLRGRRKGSTSTFQGSWRRGRRRRWSRRRSDPPVLGPEAPYTPIIHPPDVQRVWIPSRINAYGDLAAGHWIYLKIRDAEWFLKRRDDSARQRMQLDLPMVPTIRSQDPEALENQVER